MKDYKETKYINIKIKKICGTVKYVLLSALNKNVATSIVTFEW